NTGLDALTHCVEAYVSNIDDNYADAFAKGGIELIFNNLKQAVAEPENGTVRQNMHDASCLGGYAFTNAWLGIAHSMAHQIGGTFGIAHGCANAIVLPSVIRYNAAATGRYADLARLLGKSSGEEFAVAVEQLRTEVNVASSVKACGIEAEAWNREVKRMAEHAMTDPCTGFNPRKLKLEEMERLFMAVYNGDKTDF
ncbi:MAG: iron-containing alcohol dehydrogenase, partial [Bacteroidales bacterium]